MLASIPNTYQCARCRHFVGVDQPGGTEVLERYICQAFPNGIPEDLLSDIVSHRSTYPGDHGVQFEAINE